MIIRDFFRKHGQVTILIFTTLFSFYLTNSIFPLSSRSIVAVLDPSRSREFSIDLTEDPTKKITRDHFSGLIDIQRELVGSFYDLCFANRLSYFFNVYIAENERRGGVLKIGNTRIQVHDESRNFIKEISAKHNGAACITRSKGEKLILSSVVGNSFYMNRPINIDINIDLNGAPIFVKYNFWDWLIFKFGSVFFITSSLVIQSRSILRFFLGRRPV